MSGHHAVVGAGWAGCAAAVELARRGQQVTVFESSRVPGGRARRVELNGHELDNGQHILLGAYTESLRMIERVGVDLDAALLRLPLQMRYPPASGGMDFLTAALPAPLHLLVALWRASGLDRQDKLGLARFSSTARWMDWRLHADCSVSELLQRFDQSPKLVALMWRPLCIAALNTPPDQASAQVFLNVLRDSLGARRKASDMLLPRIDLSSLFPAPALEFVKQAGGTVRYGTAVTRLEQQERGWMIKLDRAPEHANTEQHGATTADVLPFDSVILATPAWESARLLEQLGMAQPFPALTHEPITTCYLQYGAQMALPLPFYALIDDDENGDWGQFVFDRGQLHAGQSGLLAVVISTSARAIEAGSAQLVRAITAQLKRNFSLPGLDTPLWSKVISEKRATFACTPGLARPGNATSFDGLVIAGDYTAGDYPATLESAVRSGIAAAELAVK
ncbi:MAG: hydroxysqualene dehydroxylase HpnE [Janthinobacterium lividum]